MVENTEKQPPFPQFQDCKCSGEHCAILGCYFERVIGRINPEKFTKIEAQNIIERLIALAEQCHCKNLENLMPHLNNH